MNYTEFTVEEELKAALMEVDNLKKLIKRYKDLTDGLAELAQIDTPSDCRCNECGRGAKWLADLILR